jgi:hypothetical protein
MQEKITYIRPKVVGPFPVSYVNMSYLHRTTLFLEQTQWHKPSFNDKSFSFIPRQRGEL